MALKNDILAQAILLKGRYTYAKVRNADGSLNFSDSKMDCSEFVLFATKNASPVLFGQLSEPVPSGAPGGNTKTIQDGIMKIMGWPDLHNLKQTGAEEGDWILWKDHVEFIESVTPDGKFVTLGANGADGDPVPKNISLQNFISVKAIALNYLGIWTPQLPGAAAEESFQGDNLLMLDGDQPAVAANQDAGLALPAPPALLATPVHLKTNNADAAFETDPPQGQAFPIYENGTVPFNNSDDVGTKIQRISDVISFLAVNDATHLRYIADGENTFCNVYAYDLSYLMGYKINKYFIPRAWWMDDAIDDINQGGNPAPVYASTVREMLANDLYQWFIDYGGNFGWVAQSDLNELQEYVNTYGEIGVIVAKKTGGHGHITIVVPEQSAPGGVFQAVRNGANLVVNPLQSQAGAQNFEYGNLTIGGDPWFLDGSLVAGFYIFNRIA